MQHNDIEIIHRILDGNDAAFAELVNKYQRSVHALVWRKIQDFHIAEELTQDIFLKVYHKLNTLKKPHCFASWLYVIASRRCTAWLRKKRMLTQPIEDSTDSESGKSKYSKYVIEENERTATEAQREIVRKLLAKLPESERTVITLRYFSDMSSAEIGAFLGVSANTVRSRLRRARNRLQKEEAMIRDALEHFKISPNLTDNIMQEISQTKQVAPTSGKPFIPWIVGVTAVTIVLLMLGFSNQFLSRFQKPYSLEAQSEMSVEIVEAPIVQEIKAQPDVRRQFGNTNAVGKNDTPRQNPDNVLLAAADVEGENEVSVPKQKWYSSKPTRGTTVEGLLVTSKEAVYSLSNGHLYKLTDFRSNWEHVSDISSITDVPLVDIPMAEWDNTLYMAPSNILYASKDDGKTWNIVHEFPEKYNSPNKLLLTDQAFYFCDEIHGAFRSDDKGKTWVDINNEFPSKPRTFVSLQDNVLAWDGANIYQQTSANWRRLGDFPVPDARACYSIATSQDKLYAFALNPLFDPDKVPEGERGWWIFRTTDFGNTWTDITPKDIWKSRVGWSLNIRLIAAGDTLIAIEQGMVRSTDAGDTWKPLQPQQTSPSMFSNSPTAVLNDHILYFGSWDYGLQRSTDGGESWDIVNLKENNGGIWHIRAVNETNNKKYSPSIIYGSTGDMIKTSDQGRSWTTILTDMATTKWRYEDPPYIRQIVQSTNGIYAKGSREINSAYANGEVGIYRFSTDTNKLNPVQDMPVLKDSSMMNILANRDADITDIEYAKQLQEKALGATQFFIQLAQIRDQSHQSNLRRYGSKGTFAVSGDTFYIEYNFKLFRWEVGNAEWQHIGLEETAALTLDIAMKDLKLAVSEDTVYVGKRDGHLYVSFDKGNNWIDLTPALPFPVKVFKEIVVAGTSVFVATDAGIITSDNGKSWNTITDAAGDNLIMEFLANDGNTLYGVTEKSGIYRLDNGSWNQVVPEIPANITSMTVDENTIYVGTRNQGMLHYTLE
ncbi:sigma-70 family RNA polymerase sigma factor [Candidatus Poribacteria bacterium]|nr:sigma-70 family RNA polymerase sigma factor [Candidatus Poribacteria bacterium]